MKRTIPTALFCLLAASAIADQRTFLVENSNLLTMASDSIEPAMDVHVLDGKIERIGPHPLDGLDEDIRRIDGTGKYLMPGLVDSHVHVWLDAEARINDRHAAQRLLVHGITRARVAFGEPELLAWRDAVENGESAGARLILSSPYITTSVETEDFILSNPGPEDARVAIRQFAEQGYDYVKVVDLHDAETLNAILDEADKNGLRVLGHYPNVNFPLDAVARSSWVSIEHFDILMRDLRAQLGEDFEIGNIVTELGPANVAVTTVGLLFEDEITADSPVGRVLRAFVELGGTLLAGTEGNFGPGGLGNTLHLELVKLSSLGLSNFDVLQTATSNANSYVRKDDNIGMIKVGYEADLLLIENDPLQDLAWLRNIVGMSVSGRWYDRKQLEEIRENLDHRENDLGED